MDSYVQEMIRHYNCKSASDYTNALKEIVQTITLLGLYRSGFFNRAAFYGGSALRMFHDMERFSEDLDFSLLKPDNNFEPENYLKFVKDELGAFGFDMTVDEKEKTKKSDIKSEFIKGNTLVHLLKISSITPPVPGINSNDKIRIKIEIDINPPGGAGYEVKYLLNPIPFSVNLFTLPSLFAGKVHAILCRNWQSRVKGRDFYDFVWYISKGVKLNISHLEKRIEKSNPEILKKPISENIIGILCDYFDQVDFVQARRDVEPFINNPELLELWTSEFFKQITRNKLIITAND